MALLFWDASALVKRYAAETGSDTVDALFVQAQQGDMASTSWGYAETFAILVRRHNGGVIGPDAFATAVLALRAEVVDDPAFTLFTIDDAMVFASIATIQRHNLNATDAAILALLLGLLPSPPPPDAVVISSDKRLLRAADAEGLNTLNPEAFAATDVPGFLASL